MSLAGPGHLLLLAGLGLVVGLFGGLLGLGGGWLVTPALTILGFPAQVCVGTSLTQMVGTSLTGLVRHRRLGNFRLKLGAAFAPPVMIGVVGGQKTLDLLAAHSQADDFLRILYVAVLGAIGVGMLWEGRRRGASAADSPSLADRLPRMGPQLRISEGPALPLYQVVVLGLTAGWVSGVLGIGGGVFLVPAMVYGLGLPTVVAVGTSLLCIFLSSATGMVSYAVAGHVDFTAAVAILTGSLGGSTVGATLASGADEGVLRRLFSTLLLLTCVTLILTQLGLVNLARPVLFTGAAVLTAVTLVVLRTKKSRG